MKQQLWEALRISRNEEAAIDIITRNPHLAQAVWDKEDENIPGSTALHYAVHYDFLTATKCLLELGADIEANTEKWYRTPLSWAADTASNRTLEFLLSQGAKPNADIGHGFIALHAAAAGGEKNGANNPQGYVEVVRLLIEAGSEKDNAGNIFEKTPLDLAVEYGNEAVAAYLKSVGARRNIPSA